MDTPPPYRPQKSNTGLIIGLIIGGVLLCCLLPLGAVGGFAWFGLKQVGPMATCAMAIEDIQDAIKDYAADHDGSLPQAASWQTEVKPYYEKRSSAKKKDNPFGVMPADGVWGCDAGETKTGFAFNAELSAKKLSEIKDRNTPLVFEVAERGMNLAMPYKPQDPSNSPKLFNERRGWFVAPLDGEPDLIGPKGERVKIETGT